MHVALGNAHQSGGDTRPAELDRVRIGACPPGGGIDLVGNFVALGRLPEPREEDRVDVGAPGDDRPPAQADIPTLRLSMPGWSVAQVTSSPMPTRGSIP